MLPVSFSQLVSGRQLVERQTISSNNYIGSFKLSNVQHSASLVFITGTRNASKKLIVLRKLFSLADSHASSGDELLETRRLPPKQRKQYEALRNESFAPAERDDDQ